MTGFTPARVHDISATRVSILLSQVLLGFAVTTHIVKGHNKVQGVVCYLAMSALNSTYIR